MWDRPVVCCKIPINKKVSRTLLSFFQCQMFYVTSHPVLLDHLFCVKLILMPSPLKQLSESSQICLLEKLKFIGLVDGLHCSWKSALILMVLIDGKIVDLPFSANGVTFRFTHLLESCQ